MIATAANSLRLWKLASFTILLIVIYFQLNPNYPFKHAVLAIPFGDTLVHVGTFAALAFSICLAWNNRSAQVFLSGMLLALAIFLEGAQAFIYDITFEPLDALANLAGVVVGYAAGIYARSPRR